MSVDVVLLTYNDTKTDTDMSVKFARDYEVRKRIHIIVPAFFTNLGKEEDYERL